MFAWVNHHNWSIHRRKAIRRLYLTEHFMNISIALKKKRGEGGEACFANWILSEGNDVFLRPTMNWLENYLHPPNIQFYVELKSMPHLPFCFPVQQWICPDLLTTNTKCTSMSPVNWEPLYLSGDPRTPCSSQHGSTHSFGPEVLPMALHSSSFASCNGWLPVLWKAQLENQ